MLFWSFEQWNACFSEVLNNEWHAFLKFWAMEWMFISSFEQWNGCFPEVLNNELDAFLKFWAMEWMHFWSFEQWIRCLLEVLSNRMDAFDKFWGRNITNLQTEDSSWGFQIRITHCSRHIHNDVEMTHLKQSSEVISNTGSTYEVCSLQRSKKWWTHYSTLSQ